MVRNNQGMVYKFSNFLDQIQNTNIFIAFYLFLDFLDENGHYMLGTIKKQYNEKI